ncbi:MAG TPA: hypothetical protein VFT12_01230, partial [Thermoanaerobaculia bacterium]|nr:hypothetical protein [Thermoanaerobaculia bacterium]
MEVPIHFTPMKVSEEGKQWEITCAQLCGLGHYRMRGMYSVHSKEDFASWMRQNTPAGGAPAPAAGS